MWLCAATGFFRKHNNSSKWWKVVTFWFKVRQIILTIIIISLIYRSLLKPTLQSILQESSTSYKINDLKQFQPKHEGRQNKTHLRNKILLQMKSCKIRESSLIEVCFNKGFLWLSHFFQIKMFWVQWFYFSSEVTGSICVSFGQTQCTMCVY